MASKVLLVVDVQEGFKNKNTEKTYKKIHKYIKENKNKYKKIILTCFVNNKKSPVYKMGDKTMFKIEETCMYKPFIEFVGNNKFGFFVKNTYACLKSENVLCHDEKLEDWLQENNIKEIDICGVETMCCVLASAFELFDADYKINILDGICANTNSKYDKIVKEIIKYNFVKKGK